LEALPAIPFTPDKFTELKLLKGVFKVLGVQILPLFTVYNIPISEALPAIPLIPNKYTELKLPNTGETPSS
jgi:hypothetical protein